MQYEVVKKISIDKYKKCFKIGEYKYFPEIDGLYFAGPYPFPVELMVSHGLGKVQVTPAFLKLPFILKGWINFDILLREIDLMNLAMQGKLLLHASCVNDTLIVGFPNSGKTYRTFRSVKEGATFISEEYTIIDNGVASAYRSVARSCLSARTIEDCDISLNIRERIELYLRTLRATFMPFMFEAAIWKEFPLSGQKAKVKRIVYGSTNIEVSDYRTLIILTENEFPFMDNNFLQAYALATGFDLLFIQNIQRDLIRSFVRSLYPVPPL